MQTFKLVNPKIIGDFNDTINANDQRNAADTTWVNLTKYMTKNVPRFLFTLENTETGKLHNFQVDETIQGKLANYDITELDSNLTSSQIKAFKDELARLERKTKHLINMDGGKRKHRYHGYKNYDSQCTDDSSTSDSDDLYDKIKLIRTINSPQPIVYWWYTPLIYTTYSLPSIYIPTFNPPLLPYVEINLSSAWLG